MRQRHETLDVGVVGRDLVAGQIHADQAAGAVEGELSARRSDAAYGIDEFRIDAFRDFAGLDPFDPRFLAPAERRRPAGLGGQATATGQTKQDDAQQPLLVHDGISFDALHYVHGARGWPR